MLSQKRDVRKCSSGMKKGPILETTEGKVIQATQSEGKLELILGEGSEKKILVNLPSNASPRIDADEHIRVHYNSGSLIDFNDFLIVNAKAVEILDKRYGNVVKFAYVIKGYKFVDSKKSE